MNCLFLLEIFFTFWIRVKMIGGKQGAHLYNMKILKRKNIHRCKGKEGLIPSNLVESASDDGSTSPLHDAAKRGNIDLLKECLLNKLPVNQMDPAGNTPLHWAARTGHHDCLSALLSVQQVCHSILYYLSAIKFKLRCQLIKLTSLEIQQSC